jgi:hypothetical protein
VVLLVVFLLLDFHDTRRMSFMTPGGLSHNVSCDISSWNWRSTPRTGLGGWMDEIGHNHIGHG